MQLRDYQQEISDRGIKILEEFKYVLLSVAVRCGKTIISFEIVKKSEAKKLLFITKKKAISSIKSDYKHYKNDFDIVIINYESIHLIKETDFDILILDEIHTLGTYPKPNNKYKAIRKRFGDLPIIGLSGTISPESYSQLFHQIHVNKHSPWSKYTNFYKWCNAGYVKITQIKTSFGYANCYKKANYDKIMKDIGHLIITFTQEEAKFTTNIEERILYIKMKPITYSLIKELSEHKVIEGVEETILADTAVSLQQKICQLSSGTVKFDSGNTKIIDDSKGIFIRKYFKDKKIGIFYNFKAEKDLLKEVFGDNITDNLDEFNSTNKNIMLQIVSGREGISLKKADYLVFFNIAFSALSYFQARDRLSTMDRKENIIYWIFSEGGIEKTIYDTVQKKKNFTNKIFKKNLENIVKSL